MSAPLDQFLEFLQTAGNDAAWVSLVLSAPQKGLGEAVPQRQTVRPVSVRSELLYQWEEQFAQKQSHVNLSLDASLSRTRELLKTTYREAYLFTTEKKHQLRAVKQGFRLRTTAEGLPTAEVQTEHNRSKQYLIPEGKPCRFLEALSIMNGAGKVHATKQKKFRQVNRYLEFIDDIYPQLPGSGPIRVIDFGCGLSYLTFATIIC